MGQAISQFNSTSATIFSSMEITPNHRRDLPYILPSDILGRYLKIPSILIVSHPPLYPMVTRITTHARVSQSVPNPISNSSLGSVVIPSMGFSSIRSQVLPHTSHTSRGPYVPFLHNISKPTPPAVGSGGPAGYGPIGSTS